MESFDEDLSLYNQWVTVYLRPTSVKNRIYYARRLNAWAADTSPWDLNPNQLVEFVLSCGKSPSTRKNAADALRSLYKWGLQTRRIVTDPTSGLPRITVPRAVPKPAPAATLKAALAQCHRRIDVAMILLATLAGLRRAEIAQLHTHDIRDEALRVTGKGGHERMVPLHADLQPILNQFETGFLFPSDKNPTGHMLPASIGQRLGDILGPGWSGHSLRHRFATTAFEGTLDILAVQQLLGHRNINTTMGYTKVPVLHLHDAVSGIALPVSTHERDALGLVP
ncbi:tyrosine-type recombinase/integrase [Arthrobacter pigmenti]